jgi:nucleoid DNA-binding protein
MGKISIQELANVLIEKKRMNKRDASDFVSAMFEIIQQHLEADKSVKVKGLGTFKIIDVEDRESVNVNTGERVLIGGHAKITYTPDVVLKELVNRPFSQFETIVLNDGVDFDDLFSGVVDDPEVEPEPVSDDDHSSMPLVDFGWEDDNPVDAHTPDVEPIVELDNETEDEFEEDFDDDINDETEPEAELEPEQIVEPEPEPIVEPKPEPIIEPKGSKVIEEITDEEIPEWVIESFAAPKSEESTPINQSADEEIAAVFDEVKEEIVPSVAEEEVLTPVIEIPEKDVSEEESEPENEPESEQEPAEPIAEPEPESEPEENVDESESEEDDDEPEFDTKPTRERKSGGMWLLALLALIVGVGGGYFLGSYYPYETLMAPAEEGTVINVQKADVEKVAAPEPKVEESVAEEPAAETAEPNEADAKAKAEADAKAKAATEEKAKADATAKAKAEEDAKAKSAADTKATSSDKYDAMDLRVRLGAYRIVGTDKVLKVKEGDDLVKISRRTLGPDMECYLEVYNNIKASTPLKVGQEIKIPKLEWKKKKKAATAN